MEMRTSARGLAVVAFGALAFLCGCKAKGGAPDIAGLIEDLKGADAEKSGRANLALINIGEAAVPAVVGLVQSDDARLRGLALTTLWGMGPKARGAVPVLVEVLGGPEADMRNLAAMALENMGPDAGPAVPALVKALGDEDNRVRQTAVKALGRIGSGAREAVPAISRALKRGSWPEAEEALRQIQGRADSPATPEPN